MRKGHARVAASFLLVVTLASCVRDPDYEGSSAKALIHLLSTHLDAQARVAAANQFYRQPPRTYETVHALLMVQAHDSDGVVRSMIAAALAKVDEKGSRALIKSLDDTSVTVRRRAAEALGSRGGGSKSAVNGLVKRLGDADDSVRTLSVLALGRIGIDAYSARDTIRGLAKSRGPQRAAALTALPDIDSESDTFLPLFEEAFSDPDQRVRLAVASNALAAARAAHHNPVPLLLRALDDSVAAVRLAALESLSRAGERAAVTVPRIEALSRSNDPEIRSAAGATLRVIPH